MSELNKNNIITTAIACGVTAIAVTSLVLGAVALGKTNAIEVPEVKEEALVGYVEPKAPMTRSEYNQKLMASLKNFNETYTISDDSFGSFHIKNETKVDFYSTDEVVQGDKTYYVPEEGSHKETSDMYIDEDKVKIEYSEEDVFIPYTINAEGKIVKGEAQSETKKATVYATFTYNSDTYNYTNYVFKAGETATAPYTYTATKYYDAFDEDFAEVMMFGFTYTTFFDSMCDLSTYYGKLGCNEYDEKDGKLLSKGELAVNGFGYGGIVSALITINSSVDATNFANGSTGVFMMESIENRHTSKAEGNFMIEPLKAEDKTALNAKITSLMGQVEAETIEKDEDIQSLNSFIARGLLAG